MRHFQRLAVVLLSSIFLLVGTRLGGTEFRIETKIYVGEEAEPASQNLTIFRAGTVYDFLSAPTQIAVFRGLVDGSGGRFTLIAPSRELRSDIATHELLKYLSELKTWAARQRDPLLKFAAHPKFEEHFDPELGKLRLESDVMRYELDVIEAKDPQTLAQYREFSDWYGRLNAVTHLGSIPPFPRLSVNASLAAHRRLPHRVQLTIPAGRPYRLKDVVIRAEHHIQWRLSRQDLDRIDQVGEHLVNFRLVPFEDFQRTP